MLGKIYKTVPYEAPLGGSWEWEFHWSSPNHEDYLSGVLDALKEVESNIPLLDIPEGTFQELEAAGLLK